MCGHVIRISQELELSGERVRYTNLDATDCRHYVYNCIIAEASLMFEEFGLKS